MFLKSQVFYLKIRLFIQITVPTFCLLLASLSCVSGPNTVSFATESALTTFYATLQLNMTDWITLAATASSMIFIVPSESELKSSNEKCFKLSELCTRFILFISSKKIQFYSNLVLQSHSGTSPTLNCRVKWLNPNLKNWRFCCFVSETLIFLSFCGQCFFNIWNNS